MRLSHILVVCDVVRDTRSRSGGLPSEAHWHVLADARRGFVDDGPHTRLGRGYVLGTGRQARVDDVSNWHVIILPRERLLMEGRLVEMLNILAAQERPVRLGEVIDRRLRNRLKTRWCHAVKEIIVLSHLGDHNAL